MSDNIDYAELDKAVSEAIKARSNEPTRAAKPAAASVTVRKSAPVAPRPVSRGRYMDFAPVHHTTPVSTPAPAPKSTPTPQPVTKSIAPTYTVTRTITTAPHPAIVPRSAKGPVHTGTTVSDMRPVTHSQHSVAAQIQKKQQKVEQAAAKVAAPKPAPKPTASKAVAPKTVEHKPVAKKAEKDDAPNANNYSLGVRSPFLTDAKVEKHPLGHNIPETSASALRSTHNVYSEKSPTKVKHTHHAKKQVVAEEPQKHSGWLWALLVILIIAAGAGLGYLAYTLVFAN